MGVALSTKSLMMLPWYPRDFMSATRGWPLAARGAYRELLDVQWDMGALPVSPAELQAICGATDAEWSLAWPKIESKFPLNCAGRKNAKLEQHREEALEYRARMSEAGRKGNEKRWGSDRLAIAKGSPPSPSPSPSPSPESKTPPAIAGAPPEGNASRKRSAPATRLPADFELTEQRRAIAEAQKTDPDREFQNFTDHWKAASGANARKHDWDATWRIWCRRAPDFKRNGSAKPKYTPSPTTEELEAREAARAGK